MIDGQQRTERRIRVKDCTVPKPYDTHWKVRSEGKEARRANRLRGEIMFVSDYYTESTLYRGGHFVEVYIVKDGHCVAVDRQRVTIEYRSALPG